MIRIVGRWHEANGALITENEEIGFFDWDTMIKSLNRWFKWGVKFEVLQIDGQDHYSRKRYQDVGLYLPDGNGALIGMRLGRGEPDYTKSDFIQKINGKVLGRECNADA